MRDASGPPRLALLVLEKRLPNEVADAIAGDLEVRYRTEIRPARGRVVADAWFWLQVLSLRAGALNRAAARLEAVRPTHERSRPGRASDPGYPSWTPIRMNDLTYALRRLVRSPGFTTVAVLSLALGIGANTAMFSVINAVLLRGLPVSDPDGLVEVYTSEPDGYPYSVSSYLDYRDLKDREDIFAGVVGSRAFIARTDASGDSQVVFGALISWDYFDVLGAPVSLGRSFLAEEDATPGSHPVVILGHHTWTTLFGADEGILGRTVRLNGQPYTVVGVAHERFTGTLPVLVTGFYLPLMMTDLAMGFDSRGQLERRGARSLFVKARLAPGITVDQANAALASFSVGLAEAYPATNENHDMSVLAASDVSLHPLVDGVLAPVAVLMLGVVGMVLLIACTNLASFLLARAEERRKEIAVRLALGAGRARLVRQLLIETTLLALLGGVAGLVLAEWTIGLLMRFRPPLPIPVDLDISLDGTVLAFTLLVSTVAGIGFGLVPALQATSPNMAGTLKDEAAGAGRPGRFNLRNGLVVTQVAFSFVLLIGAGLFVRSLQKAQTIDPGFDTGPAAIVWPATDLSAELSDDERRAFYDAFEERLITDPRIEAVAMADWLPLGAGVQSNGYLLPGVPSESRDGDHDIDYANVTASYFEVMGVPIVRGALPEPADVGGEGSVVVSEAFVHRYYPGEDAVGRTIQTTRGIDLRIVAVAADTKVRTLGEAPRPYVYQLQGDAGLLGLQVVVRGQGSDDELLAAARRVLSEVDPDVPLIDAKTMDEHLGILLFPPRMAALLLSVFGGLALLLSAIGIYGVVSYAVSRRTKELGIRMSLGASAADVVRMAIGGGMRLVAAGGIFGVLLAATVTWAISGYLYGIGPNDVVTFVAIPAILSAVALFAAWVPARRASSVDPVTALRSE